MWTKRNDRGRDNISAVRMMAIQPIDRMGCSIDLETLVSKDFEAEI